MSNHPNPLSDIDHSASVMDDYALLDSGHGRKLERFGPYVLNRPCAQALWAPALPTSLWDGAHAAFDRKEGLQWRNREVLPESWVAEIGGIRFKLSGTDFGHLGVFPEQRGLWLWISETLNKAISRCDAAPTVLNLFAYSGGASLAAAQAGATVCHLDASKGMVDWARENAALNKLDKAPIRWIVDDVTKFLSREKRRDRTYDAIILDPPSFGRGKRGEIFKIERRLYETLEQCRALLSPTPLFVLLSSHTPGFTPIVLVNLLNQILGACGGRCSVSGEMLLTGPKAACDLPNGFYAVWEAS